MKIVNWVCGIFALVLLVIFLGKYAVSIGSIALWLIIIGVILLPAVDFYLSTRESEGSRGNGGGS